MTISGKTNYVPESSETNLKIFQPGHCDQEKQQHLYAAHVFDSHTRQSECTLWWSRQLREKLTTVMNFREMMRGINEFFEAILNRAGKASQPTEEVRNAGYMFSAEAFNFIRNNLSLAPPVYFVPSIYAKFEKLAEYVREMAPPLLPLPPPTSIPPIKVGKEGEALIKPKGKASKVPSKIASPMVPPSPPPPSPNELDMHWDGAIATIQSGIELLQGEEHRTCLRNKLAMLIEAAQIPPHQTALLHSAMYKTISRAADSVADGIEGVPPSFGKPMAQKLMQTFYENFEQEQAAKLLAMQNCKDQDVESEVKTRAYIFHPCTTSLASCNL